jgi:hypothetical protein
MSKFRNSIAYLSTKFQNHALFFNISFLRLRKHNILPTSKARNECCYATSYGPGFDET